ncbi:MAG: cation:proton antiporter [Chitinophagales bacterium]
MQLSILQGIVVILGLSVLISLLFHRFKIPAIIGFLVTGVVAGPYGLSLTSATHEVELLAEMGVIFLLFIIGIEFSLKSLSAIGKTVLWGGLMQMGGTILITFLIAWQTGFQWNEALFIGFLLSLSSTAIVLKMLIDRGEMHSPQGRIALAILIAQDIIVVPLMLITPLIAGNSDNMLQDVIALVIKVVVVLAVVILLAKYIMPFILKQVVRTKSRELFILTIIVMCFATAWFTSSMGLSLALGAFFAGLIISESEYSHQAMANIIPFREIFISFFFVSIGMLLDINFFFDHILIVLLLTAIVIVIKVLISGIAAFVLGYPARTAIIAALLIFQVGEFAFVLSVTGMENNLIQPDIYQYFLAVSILTMGISPFIIMFASSIADVLIEAPLPRPVRTRLDAMKRLKAVVHQDKPLLKNHLVIIGYGINGKNLAKAATKAAIPFVVIELDPELIEEAKADDVSIVFGDATDVMILQHVALPDARVVVIAISDPDATLKIINEVRKINVTAHVIVRTRYIKDVDQYISSGADVVIPEEFETSIEIFTRVLTHYLVPRDEIEEFTEQIRQSNYEMLRSIKPEKFSKNTGLHIPDMEISVVVVRSIAGKLGGKTIQKIAFRSQHNLSLLAIRRGEQFISKLSDDFELELDDVIYIAGNPEATLRFNKYLAR